MDVKLKKCPFCGGEAFLQIRDSEGNLHDEDYEKDPGLGSLTRLDRMEGLDSPRHLMMFTNSSERR